MEFLLPEEAAPITSRGNCTPSSSPSLTTSPTHPLTKPREPPLPPLRLPPSTFATDATPHSLLTLHSRRRLTPLISSRIYWRLARSSRDDLSEIGKLTIVDRHPLLPCNNRKSRCLFFSTVNFDAHRYNQFCSLWIRQTSHRVWVQNVSARKTIFILKEKIVFYSCTIHLN